MRRDEEAAPEKLANCLDRGVDEAVLVPEAKTARLEEEGLFTMAELRM